MFLVSKNACRPKGRGEPMTDMTRKIGRPKLAPDERRTERLSGIRLTVAERDVIERAAAAAGLDVAEFCRRAILGQRIAAKRNRAENALLVELNRVGVNLNQIAHAVNAGRDLPRSFPHLLDELRAVVEKIAGGDDGS